MVITFGWEITVPCTLHNLPLLGAGTALYWKKLKVPAMVFLTSHSQYIAGMGLAPEPTGTPAFPLPHARPD